MFRLLPDLPQIPDHLLHCVADIVAQPREGLLNAAVPPGTWGRELTRDGERFASRQQPRWPAPDDLTDWVKHNITSDFKNVGIARNYGEADSLGPHADFTRDWCLIYPIKTGGCRTVFWQQHDHPLVREGNTYINNYSELEMLDGIDIPEKTWCLLNVKILHSVEGCCGDRLTVQVAFDREPSFLS